MQNGKRPTRRQKLAIAAAKLTPDNWLVYKTTPGQLHLVHRHTESKRVIPA